MTQGRRYLTFPCVETPTGVRSFSQHSSRLSTVISTRWCKAEKTLWQRSHWEAIICTAAVCACVYAGGRCVGAWAQTTTTHHCRKWSSTWGDQLPCNLEIKWNRGSDKTVLPLRPLVAFQTSQDGVMARKTLQCVLSVKFGRFLSLYCCSWLFSLYHLHFSDLRMPQKLEWLCYSGHYYLRLYVSFHRSHSSTFVRLTSKQTV